MSVRRRAKPVTAGNGQLDLQTLVGTPSGNSQTARRDQVVGHTGGAGSYCNIFVIKLMVEDISRDLYVAEPDCRIDILRYFNPVGVHASGLIGDNPQDIPNNLMPYVAQVAVGRRENLNVWGADYATADGTGVRDYISVVDLAPDHLKALESLDQPQCFAVNLGTGVGFSILDVWAFEQASRCPVLYKISSRRSADVADCYTNPAPAEKLLDWKATCDLTAMCHDHWRRQSNNPQGYA